MDRLPAYPLLTIDPMFSLWAPADDLTATDTMYWAGQTKRAYGFIRADGVTYRFMGGAFGTPLQQTDVSVRMLSTRYSFTCDASTRQCRSYRRAIRAIYGGSPYRRRLSTSRSSRKRRSEI